MNSDRLIAIAGSVVVHLILVGILVFTLWQRPTPPARTPHKPIIQARAVDEATAMASVRRREAEERRKREEAERKRQAAEAEKKRLAEEERKKIEAEKKRKLEAQRKKVEAEKRRQAELTRKAEEKKRLAEEKRKKAEAARKQEEERKHKEQEDLERRKAELQRQMDIEAERMEEEARQLRQQQLTRQQLQYVADIRNKVERNWLRTPGSTGTLCTVVINQMPGGEVRGVRVTDCDGDIAFQQSVERAVRKSSPLPMPADPELFQREIEFVFRP